MTLSKANISLDNADYIFPDVRAGNVAIGNFSDIYFLDMADMTGNGRAELFIIPRYEKDGRKYFDTRIYEMNENGASVKDDLIRKLNEKYCNVEDYPVEEAKALLQTSISQ